MSQRASAGVTCGRPSNGLNDPLLEKINWNAAVQYHTMLCLLFLCTTYHRLFFSAVMPDVNSGLNSQSHSLFHDLPYFGKNITSAHGQFNNCLSSHLLFIRAPVAQLVEHRAVTREVVSSTPAGPTLRVFK